MFRVHCNMTLRAGKSVFSNIYLGNKVIYITLNLRRQNGWVTVDEYSSGLQSHDLFIAIKAG